MTGLATTLFASLCQARGLPMPVSEYRFAPPRRWRWDWAFVEEKIAIEQQGGIWTHGRHVRGAALLKEWDKLNEGAVRGWRIVYCSPQQFASGDVLAVVERCLQ